MICVDTSVWISALRSAVGTHARLLRQLLDADQVALPAPVRVEILSGSPLRDLARLRRVFSALPVFFPTGQTWARIDAWIDLSVAAGERFGVADLLIAAIAVDQGAALWSLDEDFQRMVRLKFLQLYQA